MVKRLAFAVPGDLATPTGGYVYDRRIIAELEYLGWQVDVINLGDGFPWPSESTQASARTQLLAIPAGRVIVVDGLALGTLPDVAIELASRNPLLALVHHPLALESGLSKKQVDALFRSERAALAAARHVVVTSEATAKLVVRDYGAPSDIMTVARPGVDLGDFAQGSPDDLVRLLSVGAVVPRKGFDVLIAALAMLTDLPWHLIIVGDRTRDLDVVAQLDADIVHYALMDRVTTLGSVPASQLVTLYRQADVFVLASHFEGYGMAYAEAIAHGLPVIGTHGGAIPDTVPAKASMLFAPGDTQACAQALRHVISDAEMRRSMAAAAREAAAGLPTWRHSAEIFARAVEALS